MSKKTKITIISVLGIALAAGAGFLWINSSNEGTIKPANTADTQKTNPNSTKNFDGKYMKFTYPSSYLSQTLKASDNDLELYRLSANTTYDKNLNASVSTLPQGRLDQNSAYLLRKTRTDLYKESQVPFNGGTASVWTRNDNQEVTAFIQQGNRVALLSFVQSGTYGDSVNDLPKEADPIIRSFAWK